MKVQVKKILIISYYWPPSGGSGVQRWMYFAKYLKALGWQPYVLTVDEKSAAYPILDKSLVNEVKHIPTIRTRTREPLKWYSILRSASETKGIPQGVVATQTLFGKITAFIRGNLFIPDARKGWRSFALKAAQQLIQEEEIHKVVTTGPPHSSHWVGAQLQKEFGLKWVVDLRDPWVTLFYNAQLYRTPWAIKKDENQEQIILQTADAVITTVAGEFQDYLKSKAPKQYYFTIPNGYDTDLMESISNELYPKFHIVYTGLLTSNQEYHGILTALEELQDKYTICLSLAGQIQPEIIEKFKSKLQNSEVIIHGYLTHEEAIKLMKSADLLLNIIFSGAQKDMISGKLLEYIATQKPILSIGDPDSEAGRFLMQGSASLMVKSEKISEMNYFIEKAYQGKGTLKNIFPNLEEWSREALTKKLIQVFEGI